MSFSYNMFDFIQIHYPNESHSSFQFSSFFFLCKSVFASGATALKKKHIQRENSRNVLEYSDFTNVDPKNAYLAEAIMALGQISSGDTILICFFCYSSNKILVLKNEHLIHDKGSQSTIGKQCCLLWGTICLTETSD